MRPEQRAKIAAALECYLAAARETLTAHAQLAQDPEWRSKHDPRVLVKLDRAITAGTKRLRAAGLALKREVS